MWAHKYRWYIPAWMTIYRVVNYIPQPKLLCAWWFFLFLITFIILLSAIFISSLSQSSLSHRKGRCIGKFTRQNEDSFANWFQRTRGFICEHRYNFYIFAVHLYYLYYILRTVTGTRAPICSTYLCSDMIYSYSTICVNTHTIVLCIYKVYRCWRHTKLLKMKDIAIWISKFSYTLDNN